MTAGLLNQRITVRHQVTTKNTVGEPVKTWHPLYEDMSAQLMKSASTEPFEASQLQNINRSRFRVRYRSDISITAAMQIVWKGRLYGIVGDPVNVRGQNEWLDIEVISGARDGR